MGGRSASTAKRRVQPARKPSKKDPVAPTEPLSFFHLPNEVVGLIAQQALAIGGHRLVHNFSFTDRRTFELSQRELYRHIVLHDEVEIAYLTRSLIENPSLRRMIRSVSLHTNSWCCRQADSDRILREWPNTPVDESKLSQSDRQLLILSRSHCNRKASDNIQCVFGLFLFFINQAKHITIEIDWYWVELDNFLAAGLASYAALASDSSSGPSFYTALLPALQTLKLSTKRYLRKPVQTIQSRPFHPFKALTASTNLRVFDFDGDMEIWGNLDDIDPYMKLPFTTVKLVVGHCTSSSLCKFLRHCPDLQWLKVAPQGYAADYGTEECINTVLPKFCPRLRGLSLRLGGTKSFFRSGTKILNCLPEMTNLRELRIEVDAFLQRSTDIATLKLANKLPEQLEKLFVDASFALIPFPIRRRRMTARSLEAVIYKRAVENMVQNLCKARTSRFSQLNTIIVGAKYSKPVQWTKDANKTLAGIGARVKVTNGTEIQKLWSYSWDEMKI
ncbi:uncharacterized protein ColSpa_11335 [Colletotrichum spaethianum]|uniref:Uncharacterized protein n=1 Tax=Colletotrichum spaethianum TaxID=700344 RepID=A0AA37PFA8_9PEZI|nr:uncharacterized protein ColSpa_11335 [Colletotrichum spaethianum]GKT51154.1 hypothetical protein ColSpa_11335 [Colletotrichum spaethianum]